MKRILYIVLLMGCHALCMVAQNNALPGDTIRYIMKDVLRTDTLHMDKEDRMRTVQRIEIDTVGGTALSVHERVEKLEVIKSVFRRDWFIFASVGGHTFLGDYSGNGDFSGTLSPEVCGGVGYWFNPYIGLSARFIRSESRGYSEYIIGGHGFGYGELLEKADGTLYRKMKMSWWDTSLSLMLNVTRLVSDYEGYRSGRHMNQFILNLGAGCVHQLNYEQEHGTGYDWSGHAELQYSRFLGRKKRVSLDVRLRALFYHTNFDYESKRHDRLIDRTDWNIGVHAGITCYLGRLRGKKRIDRVLEADSFDYTDCYNRSVPSAK